MFNSNRSQNLVPTKIEAVYGPWWFKNRTFFGLDGKGAPRTIEVFG